MDPAAGSETLLAALSDHVAAQTGLRLPRERWPELSNALTELIGEAGAALAQAHLYRLLTSPLSRAQIETLARHLAVGETYFFREPDTFDALEHDVLAPLVAARCADGSRRLNLWSAGCCTGEETYSLAILLERLVPDSAGWDITLLGTDIHPGFLARAEQGVYGDWSFRGVRNDIKARYFDAAGPGLLAVRPELKRRVRFAYFNLAEDADPGWRMDLIVCRNVLMYFDPESAAQALARLHRCLADDGWLALGAAETPLTAQGGFAKVASQHANLYRKQPIRVPAPHASAPALAPTLRREPAASPRVDPAAGLAERARAHADGGRLAEADRCCRAAIAADKCNPRLHYLHSLVLEEAMRFDEARAALRRALYFGPQFVLGHVALGRLCERQGERAHAAAHFAKALGLIEREGAGELLPESDGLSAAQLSAALAARLQEA
jgi:chemotaxis protein methyltransferase CheR